MLMRRWFTRLTANKAKAEVVGDKGEAEKESGESAGLVEDDLFKEIGETPESYFEEICAHLDHGPVILGEAHQNNYGRKLLRRLIDVGVVRHLFLEVPSTAGASSTDGAEAPSSPIGHADIVNAGTPDLDKVRIKKDYAIYTIPQIAQYCLDLHIDVYFIDHPTEYKRWDSAGVKLRDKFMSQYFNAWKINRSDIGKGALIYVGSRHVWGGIMRSCKIEHGFYFLANSANPTRQN
jgi:hypothetical protein